jgi:hypothetical protein
MREPVLGLVFVMGALALHAQIPAGVQNASGVRMVVDEESAQPALRIVVPGVPDNGRAIVVLFPEHTTVRKKGEREAEHLYVFQPGKEGDWPAWKSHDRTLEYTRKFNGGVLMTARATLEDDGVRFWYGFANSSDVEYEMVTAITDPRMTSVFHDVRLERTYVHRADGFGLLAAETPERLTMPLSEWLPARYMDSFTWPVPAKLVDRRPDGITYYNSARPVDEPMIATLSSDRRWVVASFTKTTGNVWSNPELTCQHVDPWRALPPHGRGEYEVKVLIFQGTLDEALEKVRTQRSGLR